MSTDIDYSYWERLFYEAFNNAYQSYLNEISPSIFMDIFLEKITKITDSGSGFIGSVNSMDKDEKMFLSVEAINNKMSSCDEICIPSSLLVDIDNKKSLCFDAITDNKIIIMNDVEQFPGYNVSYKKYGDITTCVCIPYSFNESVTGIIVLANRSEYTDDMKPMFKVLAILVGILQNSYFKIKKTTLETDDRFITYKLLEHVINISSDATIVTTNLFSIKYINQYAANIITNIKNTQPKSPYSLINKNLMALLPELSTLNSSQQTIFKNKIIEVKLNEKNMYNEMYTIEFIINSVICHNKIYHIIMVYGGGDNLGYEQKNQTNFIAFLSHELRNPLQSLNMASSLLQTTLGSRLNEPENEKVKSYTLSIQRSCNEMKKIISDILNLSKIEANEFSIDCSFHNIKEIANDIYNEYLPVAHEKNLQLELNLIEENLPETLFTDDIRLHQILSNLILNAIKYSKKGKITLTIKYSNIQGNHNIEFLVSDEGKGIRKEEIKKLFKQFCQTSCSDKFDSNGLGLCISQKIAYLLGGKITAQSEHGKGSIFTLIHPIRLGNSGTYKKYINPTEKITGNILIVDDNESNLDLFEQLLKNFNKLYEFNLNVNIARDGNDAIVLCKEHKYDIIFMDINMPIMDGCTASKIIKNNGYIGHIIATTGNILAKKENHGHCNDTEKYSYFDDVIIKPYDSDTILKILKKILIK